MLLSIQKAIKIDRLGIWVVAQLSKNIVFE